MHEAAETAPWYTQVGRLRMGSMVLMVHLGLVDVELKNATDHKENHGESAQNPGDCDSGCETGDY